MAVTVIIGGIALLILCAAVFEIGKDPQSRAAKVGLGGAALFALVAVGMGFWSAWSVKDSELLFRFDNARKIDRHLREAEEAKTGGLSKLEESGP